jgi:hypothetical protein
MMCHAATSGSPKLISYILNREEGPKGLLYHGGLIGAAYAGHEDLVKFFLPLTTMLQVPLHHAEARGHSKIAQLIRDRSLELNYE